MATIKPKITCWGSFALTLCSLVTLVLLAQSASNQGWQDFFGSWQYWQQTLILGVFAGMALGLAGFWMVAQGSIYSALALSSMTIMGTLVVIGLAGSANISDSLLVEAIGMAFSLGIYLLANRFLKGRFQNDAIIAVIYLLSTAGIILISGHIAHGHHEIESHLFGNSISVPQSDFNFFVPAFVLLIILATLFYKPWRNMSFDAVFCKIRNMGSAKKSELMLFVFLFLTLMFSARNFGILVTFSLFLFAPLTALHQSKSNLTTIILSGLYGFLLFPAGFLVSYFLDWPTGACISGIGFSVFAISQFFEIMHDALRHRI